MTLVDIDAPPLVGKTIRSAVLHVKKVSRVKGTVRLTIQERDCILDVGEIGDEYPVLIGHIPLTALDWVIDTKGQRLIGNPDHGGEWGMDAF
jgi:hypothetical protein